MDTDFINFRDEERFPFEAHSFFDGDESTSLDGTDSYSPWEWEQEREINGDIAIIPMSSNFGTDIILSNSPPSKEDFQKIMSEWHQMMNLENDNAQEHVDDASSTFPMEGVENLPVISQNPSKDPLDVDDHESFDITSYVNETKETKPVPERPKIGGKKIDVLAQRYIVDDPEDCHVDVETISEHDSSPILQANDLDSLLEQFEASEPFSPVTENELMQTPSLQEDKFVTKTDLPLIKQEITDECYEQYEAGPENKSDHLESSSVKVFKEEAIDTYEQKPDINSILITKSPPSLKDGKFCDSNPLNDVKNNKQIIEALPQELIMRIKETGKRKPIAVIPAIPNKKRNANKQDQQGKQKLTKSDFVQLEHNYCSKSMLYPKNPKKDSGFESSEDDERSLIRNQPTVKTADGKLMVSLLKSKTIHHNIKVEQPKRKLNLEEYKKRREGFIKSCETSSNNSPANSGCNSPVPEDEQTKIRRYQEKIIKMATEILKTPAKSKSENTPTVNTIESISSPVVAPNIPSTVPPQQTLVVPDNMEVRTIVSIGVNTDTECIPICAPPVKHLEEIKPILQKASVKIDSNSLITSLIENIPKVKHKLPQDDSVVNKPITKTEEHGEDKTILFLPKDRKQVSLCDAQIQTESVSSEMVVIGERRRRRGSSSSSSTSSRHSPHRRCRNSSNSSRYSYSSTSSSRSSSRSRSRSISPWTRKRQRVREEEKIREVEERRVIYVGRISSSCTRDDLRRRFEKFGQITNVSVHFRDHADNYGFVTFMNKLDAYEAVEHGNDDPFYPKYDLSFGGRRMFCKTSYSDLDDMKEDCYYPVRKEKDSFDALLRKAQEKLKKRKP